MNRAVFYIQEIDEVSEIWSKCYEGTDTLVHDVRISNNPEYGGVDSWKSHSWGEFATQSEFSNELYHYYFIPIIYRFMRYVEEHNIAEIQFTGSHTDYYFLAGYFQSRGIKVEGVNDSKLNGLGNKFKTLQAYLKAQIAGVLLFVYYAFKYRRSRIDEAAKEFALIHSFSAYNKISRLNKDLVYYYDSRNVDLTKHPNAYSFYSIIPRWEYFRLILTSYWHVHRVYRELKSVSERFFGSYGSTYCANFFAYRIGHFLLIKAGYKEIFNQHQDVNFYSGERESRYGPLAMRLTEQSGNHGIAIPHGIAYSYNFPLGLFGHLYYCCTQRESEFLREVFDDSKFIFDKKVNEKIYRTKAISASERKVVFFTEPRRWKVNLLILKELTKSLNQTVYIKLHPLDLESRYDDLDDIAFLSDFDEAINSNICLSRKSTILLEALYNNSHAIATLVDRQDSFDYYNTFPALADSSILQLNTFKEILDSIRKL